MNKVLIIRLSSIGDIVLTTPVIRCIKQQLPGAEVHFAVKQQFLPVVESNPFINKVHIFEGKLKPFIRGLRKENFDYIVDLHQNLRSWTVRGALGVPSKGFPKLNLKKWLLTRFKFDLLPDVHIVDRYFKAAENLGVKNDGRGLDYFIPQAEEFDRRTLPPPHNDGYLAFVIGAKHATKRLPVRKILDICREVGSPVILLGGKEDMASADEITRNAGPLVISFCGTLSLNRSASLVRQADAVITHDTGLMHIAAAFGKKVISVWGNTVPEFGMSPYMPGSPEKSVIIEVKGLPCRPCSKIGHDECPKKHFRCMEEQDPKKIARTLGL